MKKIIYLLALTFIASSVFMACDDDDNPSPFKRITLGAQDNTTIGGFYSIADQKVYTLDQATTKQETIDLLCFYEEGRNNITIASPGANITGIFTGDNSPENWTVTDTTYFCQVDSAVFYVDAFDALTENDAIIQTLFDTENNYRKAKLLEENDIYAFQTEDNLYGLFKVVSVTQGETGSVEIDYIIKK